jgi:hypothetical protein
VTSPRGLKPCDFSLRRRERTRFSQTSYTSMRHVPQTDGGSHRSPNDVRATHFPTILVSDIHGSYDISVSLPATRFVRAHKVAPIG